MKGRRDAAACLEAKQPLRQNAHQWRSAGSYGALKGAVKCIYLHTQHDFSPHMRISTCMRPHLRIICLLSRQYHYKQHVQDGPRQRRSGSRFSETHHVSELWRDNFCKDGIVAGRCGSSYAQAHEEQDNSIQSCDSHRCAVQRQTLQTRAQTLSSMHSSFLQGGAATKSCCLAQAGYHASSALPAVPCLIGCCKPVQGHH